MTDYHPDARAGNSFCTVSDKPLRRTPIRELSQKALLPRDNTQDPSASQDERY